MGTCVSSWGQIRREGHLLHSHGDFSSTLCHSHQKLMAPHKRTIPVFPETDRENCRDLMAISLTPGSVRGPASRDQGREPEWDNYHPPLTPKAHMRALQPIHVYSLHAYTQTHTYMCTHRKIGHNPLKLYQVLWQSLSFIGSYWCYPQFYNKGAMITPSLHIKGRRQKDTE